MPDKIMSESRLNSTAKKSFKEDELASTKKLNQSVGIRKSSKVVGRSSNQKSNVTGAVTGQLDSYSSISENKSRSKSRSSKSSPLGKKSPFKRLKTTTGVESGTAGVLSSDSHMRENDWHYDKLRKRQVIEDFTSQSGSEKNKKNATDPEDDLFERDPDADLNASKNLEQEKNQLS